MQNTPDRHPARFSGPLSLQDSPGQHPCRIPRPDAAQQARYVNEAAATQFCSGLSYNPQCGLRARNGGCPGQDKTGQDRTGQDRTGRDRAGQGAWDGTGSSAKEATKKRREEPREQRRSSRGSRKNNDRNSSGSRTGTMQDQPKQQKEQRQEQRRGKTGTAAEATAGRTEEGKLQRKIRSSTDNPEAAFAKNFNNKAAIKSQPNSQIR